MKHRIRVSALALALLLGFSCLAACGKKSSVTVKNEGLNVAPTYAANEVEYGSGAIYKEDAQLSGSPAGTLSSQKLIRNLSYSMESRDFDASILAVQTLVASCGGYVESSTVSGSMSQGRTRNASYVLRIPASALKSFNDELTSIGNILSSSEQVQDVTLNYYDLDSRVKALEAQRDALLEMLEKAEKLEEMLTIRDHLSKVEYQLESYASQLRLLASQVDYSSVSLTIREVITYTEPEPESFLERLGAAFRDSLAGCGEFLEEALLFLLGNLPALLLLSVVIAVPSVCIVKKLRKRRQRKTAESVSQDSSGVKQ